MLSECILANTRIAQVVRQRIPHRWTNHRKSASGGACQQRGMSFVKHNALGAGNKSYTISVSDTSFKHQKWSTQLLHSFPKFRSHENDPQEQHSDSLYLTFRFRVKQALYLLFHILQYGTTLITYTCTNGAYFSFMNPFYRNVQLLNNKMLLLRFDRVLQGHMTAQCLSN